jgi:hypothetical protein
MGCNCGGGNTRAAAAARARTSPERVPGCGADAPLYEGRFAEKKIWIVGDDLYRQEHLTAAAQAARAQRLGLRSVYASQLCQSAVDDLYPV